MIIKVTYGYIEKYVMVLGNSRLGFAPLMMEIYFGLTQFYDIHYHANNYSYNDHRDTRIRIQENITKQVTEIMGIVINLLITISIKVLPRVL